MTKRQMILLVILTVVLGWYVIERTVIIPHAQVTPISPNQTNAEKFHTEGLRLFHKGKFNEAMNAWFQELNFDRQNPGAYNNIGLAYQSLEDFQAAVQYHKKALEVNPHFGDAYYSLGWAYYAMQDYEESKKAFTMAIELSSRAQDAASMLEQVRQRESEQTYSGPITASDFKKAVEADNVNQVRLLLKKGGALIDKGTIERSFLNAAFRGREGMAKVLTPYVADKNAKERVLRDSSGKGYVTIVRAILTSGVNVNAHDENFETALRSAAMNGQADIVTLLLQNGAQVNYQGEDSWTPLMDAAYNGYLDIVQLLITAGANANAKTRDGLTALDLAKKNEHSEIVRWLRQVRTR